MNLNLCVVQCKVAHPADASGIKFITTKFALGNLILEYLSGIQVIKNENTCLPKSINIIK